MPMFISNREVLRRTHGIGRTAFMALARSCGGTAEDINKIEEEQSKHLELKSADRPVIKDDHINA